MTSKFYRIKEEVRILGLDDGPFSRGDREVVVVGVVFRGGSFLDGVLSTKVEVDGLDATDKIIGLVNGTKFRDLRVVMIDGLGFGGFNLVDIGRFYNETKLPIIVVVRDKPDFDEIKSALENLPYKEERWRLIEKASEVMSVETKPGKKIHMQFSGIKEEDAREIVKLSATRSLIPEPIRVAHLIAQGIVLGESKGKA
jgi:endonuclease V-like protein UPF0215 family